MKYNKSDVTKIHVSLHRAVTRNTSRKMDVYNMSDLYQCVIIFRAGTVDCCAPVNYDIILMKKGSPVISMTPFLSNQGRARILVINGILSIFNLQASKVIEERT